MIKNYSLILIASICFVLSGYGQGSETFTNLTAPAGSYGNGSYTGDNGVTWTYDGARSVTSGDNITGRTIGFGASSVGPRNVTATSDANGVGDISYTVSSYFTGGTAADRTIEVYVGGNLYETHTLAAEGPDYSRTITANEAGAVLIEFRSTGTRQIVIDDVSWTSAVTTDPNLAIAGSADHGSSCLSTAATTVQYTISNSGVLPAAGVNVSSDDTQFVVSNLSSTTIPASGSATFDITFTPTAVGTQNATITVSSTTPTSNSPTIDLDGTGITSPSISTQPANQNEVIPNAATFDVTSTDATSYQWQVSINGGTTWANVTGGSGATTDSYTTVATSAPMDGNLYRCILTNACGSTTSNSASLSLSNNSPSNAQNLEGCFEDTLVNLSWNNPATPPTGGYVIFALEGTTDPTAPTNDASTYTANANYNAAPFETPASLGKVVYKGNGTNATVTGLTEDLTYSFRIFAYNGESLTGWSNGTSGGSNEEGIAQGDVRNLVATPLTNQVNLNWNNPLPTSCFDELIIVANTGTVTFIPSGTYAPIDVNYTTPNTVMFATTGTQSSKALNGFVNGTNYCFKVFIRRGATWSEGVEVCAVPSLTYCTSNGDGTDTFLTLINNVEFNTINNASPTGVDNDYSDFTAISTTVTLGETYNLDVRVETDGAFTTTSRAWIDWNNDGDFNDSGEQYELGNAYNVVDGSTDGSPLAIEVPTNAVIAATRMRISTRFDTTAATSCQTGYDGEVEDYTINITQPANAEINIKGNNISIADGFNAPYGLNNTLFASTNVGTTTLPKSYFIENLGATTLNLTGAPRVELIGANSGDFNVTLQPAATVGSLSDSEFRIEFSPTGDGIRTATVRIVNSDSDENPYEFDIEGTAECTTILTSSIWPTEGPENTEITITSATDLTGATASINGLVMSIVSTNATELVVLVPSGAVDANIIVDFSTGCSSNNAFNVIDDVISGCETISSSTVPSDLFISEISDATSGSSSLIEIFNGTASNIDLSDYSIRVFNNGSGTPSTTANLTGILAPSGVHVISVGTTSCDLTGNGLPSGLPHQTFNSAGGVNFDNNSSDAFELYNNVTTTSIDVFGELGSSTWANGLGIGSDGVNYKRQNNATPLPSTVFDLSQWDEIDWTSCGDSDYSGFGIYDFSLGIPPTVSVLSAPTLDCTNTIQLSVVGTQGVSGGFGLTYQWYYLTPNTTTFVVVPNNADFNNVTTSTLDIVNPIAYDDYQFYCQVRENTSTCYQASNAVKIDGLTTVWDGVTSTWSAPPTIARYAIIDGNYNTSAGGSQISFSACGLVVNSTFDLDIQNGDYIEIENDIVANGNITVSPQGSVVQNNDLATVTGSGTMTVQKLTSTLNTPFDYTYWSSPVANENVENVFSTVPTNRRFFFNASNFIDNQIEIANTGTFILGQDDIDDDGNDWQPASGVMTPGIGYAATPSTIGPAFPVAQQFPFIGPFNNGVITPTIVNNSGGSYNDWNLIGNPYPSAISTETFFSVNSGITNAIYLWSHATPEDVNASGNEGYNFSGSDYAVISGSGVNNPGGDGITPNNFVPSGQGFFIEAQSAGSITFNNSMRVTNSNDQFFRNTITNRQVLRLKLRSDNGVANYLTVAHIEGATDGNDGSFYDVERNASTQKFAKIYSLIDGNDAEYVIQGKNPTSLDMDEIIEIGFSTFIESATIYTISIHQFEGAFYADNIIYLRDNLLNTVHNLTDSDYTFTSETGVFNSRFEIVFTPSALSIDDSLVDTNDLTITELSNDEVQFKIGKKLAITNVLILDVLGREIYNLQGNNATEVYDLSNLSNTAYVAKVKLSNGQVISKKAIKRY